MRAQACVCTPCPQLQSAAAQRCRSRSLRSWAAPESARRAEAASAHAAARVTTQRAQAAAPAPPSGASSRAMLKQQLLLCVHALNKRLFCAQSATWVRASSTESPKLLLVRRRCTRVALLPLGPAHSEGREIVPASQACALQISPVARVDALVSDLRTGCTRCNADTTDSTIGRVKGAACCRRDQRTTYRMLLPPSLEPNFSRHGRPTPHSGSTPMRPPQSAPKNR